MAYKQHCVAAIIPHLKISRTAGARLSTATNKMYSTMSAPNVFKKMLPLFYWLARFSWSC